MTITETDPRPETAPDEAPSAPRRVVAAARARGRAVRARIARPRKPKQGMATPGSPPTPPAAPPTKAKPAPDPRMLLVSRILNMVAVLLLALAINLFLVSPLFHWASQTQLYTEFRQQLAEATAPVSELDPQGALLADGTPVAIIQIPAIGVEEVVVEGTTSGDLMAGPGHRRDTVLPGQFGTSIIYGRSGAYGGPFTQIGTLSPGDTITVITGQGRHTYRIIDVRYAGDPSPAPPRSDEGRLVLVSARGFPFVPTGVLRVDAELTSQVYDQGGRVTPTRMLPPAAEPMAGDDRTLWALVLWLQALLIVAAGAVLAWRHWGRRQTWVVIVPVGMAVGLQVATQITLLMPNLL